MRKQQERTEKRLRIMKECISSTTEKKEAIRKFIEDSPCHISTAEDYYKWVVEGQPSKRITNRVLRTKYKIANEPTCYFCEKVKEETHHFDYLNDKTIALCKSCHGKAHWLFERYHRSISEKDNQLMKIKKILFESK